MSRRGAGGIPDPLTGVVANDSFAYTVIDDEGFESVLATVQIQVLSSLIPTSVVRGEAGVDGHPLHFVYWCAGSSLACCARRRTT